MRAKDETFDDFWVFYVKRHRNKLSRTLHVAGTTVAMGLVGVAIVRRRVWPLVLAPVAGYGLAWAGHLLFEKNMPTSFSHPIWALRAGVKMWIETMTGRMDGEVARCVAERPDADDGSVSAPDASLN
jgi:hypothetical protein